MSESDLERELKLSSFYAALKSYKRNRILPILPQQYIINGEKNFDKLNNDIIKIIRKEPIDSNLEEWLCNKFTVTLCKSEEIKFIKNITKQVYSAPSPNYIFQVKNTNPHKLLKSYFAYHGSSFENLFPILIDGLVPDYRKDNLFGEGIYFSSELSMSLNYSKCGRMWKGNKFGEHLSFVLVCELYDNLSNDILSSKDKTTPDTYFIVKNKGLVDIRYILLYTTNEMKRVTSIQIPYYNALKSRFTLETWVIPLIFYLGLIILLASTKSGCLKLLFTKKFFNNFPGNDIY